MYDYNYYKPIFNDIVHNYKYFYKYFHFYKFEMRKFGMKLRVVYKIVYFELCKILWMPWLKFQISFNNNVNKLCLIMFQLYYFKRLNAFI